MGDDKIRRFNHDDEDALLASPALSDPIAADLRRHSVHMTSGKAPPLITERYLERDGKRILWRIMLDGTATLDVLTDDDTLTRARLALTNAPERSPMDVQLGTFGPFAVTMSSTNHSKVAVAVDGPNLGDAFRGDQAIVFYVTRSDLLVALDAE